MIPGCVASVAAAEWLRTVTSAWAWVVGLAALATLALVAARRPRTLAAGCAALATAALAAALLRGAHHVRQIDCCWPAVREGLVTRASMDLDATLSASVAEARRLADQSAALGGRTRSEAFAALAGLLRQGPADIERGAVVTSENGAPWAWAGRHRFAPANDTAPIRVVMTPFYVSLEARRQTPQAGTAVGTVLLDASPVAPDGGSALSSVFVRQHKVGLRFFPPRLAPAGSDVFDYTTPHGDTLFSVEAVPPDPADARAAALATTTALVDAALAITLLLLLVAAPPARWRWMVVVVGAWCVTRAPVSPQTGLAGMFSSATFHRSLLGVFTSSSGALTVLAALILFAAVALWRCSRVRRWWSYGAAALLILPAPYLVRNLGRGITPPVQGVSIPLWLSWETALAVATMALILLAAALVRGSTEPRKVPWTLPVGCAWALLAGLAGLWLWEPGTAWPEWYTWVWLPALVSVLVPAPRRWAVVGIATVAGTAAALVTWGAAVEGRVALADRDARGLGRERDTVAVAALQEVGEEIASSAPPRTASDLYALWLPSRLATERYPTVLSVWTATGEREADLPLAALDLPDALLAGLVRTSLTHRGPRAPRIERVDAVPGTHYVLIAPLPDERVLVVGVGPRSRLLPSSRVARFLHGDAPATPPYAISLSPPSATTTTGSDVEWTRAGWSARGERRIDLPGGIRHVHVSVDLEGPWSLIVRGALVVMFDVVLLAACWLLGVILMEGWSLELAPVVAAVRTSYRLRLVAALAAFFVLPVLAFALWSFAQLSGEVRDVRDLLIHQTLKDAAAAVSTLPLDRPELLQRAVVDLGARVDADLWLYREGVLAGASAPVLNELGLVDPFLTSSVFRRLALEDQLDLTADGSSAGRRIRVGYRVVAADPGTQTVLAAPQLLDDEGVRQRQETLALTLVLATCAGLIAAVYLAGVAARALARPVAALREAAVAVGRGVPLPGFPPGTPREFEPVVSAFGSMAADVRSSQAALEEARQRTAQVLANVATGVVAVDDGMRVTMANPRAVELVGAPLDTGADLAGAAPGAWAPVWDAVRQLAAGGLSTIAEREFTIAGRQIRVQVAPLGPSGCVIALDDATALTRAARVLAWGEMARQVAHEIKNPLTPIRLGIQHLQRVRRTSATYDATLRDTAARILAEIDRLDAIARTFSRFGSPAAITSPRWRGSPPAWRAARMARARPAGPRMSARPRCQGPP